MEIVENNGNIYTVIVAPSYSLLSDEIKSGSNQGPKLHLPKNYRYYKYLKR
jgi:hypothetical protein